MWATAGLTATAFYQLLVKTKQDQLKVWPVLAGWLGDVSASQATYKHAFMFGLLIN